MKRRALVFALVGLTLSAGAAGPVRIVSFSPILGEIGREVGGARVTVVDLVGPGVDPHGFQPSPADLKQAGHARLILASGGNPGRSLGELRDAAGRTAAILQAGDFLPPLTSKLEKGPSVQDPHWWHSVDNVRKVTAAVRDKLITLDPAGEAGYRANAAGYLARLDELEAWEKRKVAELARDKRKLVTSHDAFQYLARDFDFTVLAIEGVSTESEPSSRHVAELIDEIEREGVKAIFLESTLNPKVTREITRETGARIGGILYADGLGTGDAATYAGMMKHNLNTIVEALK